MGQERYAHHYSRRCELPPSLFEAERFCLEFHKEDSHHRRMQPYYERLYERFNECRYVGDKIPTIAGGYGPLLASYSMPRIILMVRNPFDVAASFNGRATKSETDPKDLSGWSPQRRVPEAMYEWNLAMQLTLQAWDRMRVLVMPYEVTLTDPTQLDRLLQFLELEDHKSMRKHFREIQDAAHERPASAHNALSSEEKFLVLQQADIQSCREVLARGGFEAPPVSHALINSEMYRKFLSK